jgi:hypothetical protein
MVQIPIATAIPKRASLLNHESLQTQKILLDLNLTWPGSIEKVFAAGADFSERVHKAIKNKT